MTKTALSHLATNEGKLLLNGRDCRGQERDIPPEHPRGRTKPLTTSAQFFLHKGLVLDLICGPFCGGARALSYCGHFQTVFCHPGEGNTPSASPPPACAVCTHLAASYLGETLKLINITFRKRMRHWETARLQFRPCSPQLLWLVSSELPDFFPSTLGQVISRC